MPEPSLPFRKMHGLGNDFVIVDNRRGAFHLTAEQAARIADRNTGVGCDQFIEMRFSERADVRMHIRNPDGSQAAACGNATRCVANILFAEKGRNMLDIEVEGQDQLLSARKLPDGMVQIDMGKPKLEWQDIPLKEASDTRRIDVKLGPIDNPALWGPGAVNMGNPHAVFFVDDAEATPVEKLGPMIENHPMFPERTNVEFCHVIDPNTIRMRVWERGAGVTRACGSGACAAVVAGARRRLIGRKCVVILDGGPLAIEWAQNDHVLMSGPTAESFNGILASELLAP